MKILTKVFFLTCVMLSLSGCDYIFPSTWNYRITVEIETPEGVKTGSAVRQVKAQLQLPLNPDIGDIVHTVYGEAVAIDLGKRGIVFALIDWDSYYEVYKAFPTNAKTNEEKLKYYRSLKSGTKAKLASTIFIASSDLFIKKVKQISSKDFENIFGKGVRLKAITIEITNDPITWGSISKYLKKSDTIGPYTLVRRQHK